MKKLEWDEGFLTLKQSLFSSVLFVILHIIFNLAIKLPVESFWEAMAIYFYICFCFASILLYQQLILSFYKFYEQKFKNFYLKKFCFLLIFSILTTGIIFFNLFEISNSDFFDKQLISILAKQFNWIMFLFCGIATTIYFKHKVKIYVVSNIFWANIIILLFSAFWFESYGKNYYAIIYLNGILGFYFFAFLTIKLKKMSF